MMMRIIYFVHSVKAREGVFCVVPVTYKSNFNLPCQCHVDDEPDMIGIEAEAGDAILFTENLRHGGSTNVSPKNRKILHVGYVSSWMVSQNISTMDVPAYLKKKTWERYDLEQRNLFRFRLQDQDFER